MERSVGMMLFSAVFYGVCSGSMNFINKYLMTSLDFPFPALMIFLQLILLAVGLRLLNIYGIISLVRYDAHHSKAIAPQSVLYSANTAMALIALNGMNVPMYNAIRRCNPLASMILAYIVFRKVPTRKIFASIIIITLGAVVAAHGDLAFDVKAYVFGGSSVLLMALNLTLLQYNGTEKLYSTNDLLYINALNCIPIMGFICWWQSDDIMSAKVLSDPRFLPALVIVVLSGCLLNYSMFLCTTVNSALTTTCVGVIKSVATTIIGMFSFGGVVLTSPFVLGQSLNFVGGLLYAYAKYEQQQLHQLPT